MRHIYIYIYSHIPMSHHDVSPAHHAQQWHRPGELLARLPCGHIFHKEQGGPSRAAEPSTAPSHGTFLFSRGRHAQNGSGRGSRGSGSCFQLLFQKKCFHSSNFLLMFAHLPSRLKCLISRLKAMQVKLTTVFIPEREKKHGISLKIKRKSFTHGFT